MFELYYYTWYGRRHFVLPILLLLTVLSFTVALVAITALDSFPNARMKGRYDLPKTAIAGVAGAYLWVSYDFIARARRLDFSPSDLTWGALRLVIAVPLGYAFSVVGGPVVAFALGALPLSKIMDGLRSVVQKVVPMPETSQTYPSSVALLQGVDEDVLIRLADEGISTIPQIAYCDPIRLIMRTSLPFNFVMDCMNQALSWMYFEDQMRVLRPLGLRGATEIADFMQGLQSQDPQTRAKAEAALKDVTTAIKPPHTDLTMRFAFDQIAGDPYTQFLYQVWEDPLGVKDL